MRDEREAMIAACGLECATCPIRLVSEKGEAAEKGHDCGSHDSGDKADKDAGTEAKKGE